MDIRNIVRHSFEFPEVDYFKTKPSFVGLVVGISEGRKDFFLSFEICGTCDHLDFPQSIVKGSSTIVCSMAIIYALAGLCTNSMHH